MVPSTQDFSTSSSDSGNTVILVDSTIAGINDQPLLGKAVTEENRIANERAVENFMRRNMVREDNRIEGRTNTVENSNLNQTKASDIKQYKNFHRRPQRKAVVERMDQHVARIGEVTEPLQLFIGEATAVDKSPNSEEVIIWEHRTRLVQTPL